MEGYLDPDEEMFFLIPLQKLTIPQTTLVDMLFRYSAMEMCTAVKPAFMKYLLGYFEKVIYMDPDIFVMSPLTVLVY